MPAEAIKPTPNLALRSLGLNAEYAKTWPNITVKKEAPADAKTGKAWPASSRILLREPPGMILLVAARRSF